MKQLDNSAVSEVLLPDGKWHPITALPGEVVTILPAGLVPVFFIEFADGSEACVRADSVLAFRGKPGQELASEIPRRHQVTQAHIEAAPGPSYFGVGLSAIHDLPVSG